MSRRQTHNTSRRNRISEAVDHAGRYDSLLRQPALSFSTTREQLEIADDVAIHSDDSDSMAGHPEKDSVQLSSNLVSDLHANFT